MDPDPLDKRAVATDGVGGPWQMQMIISCDIIDTVRASGVLFDRCSGRTSCNVSVRSLVDSRPCQRDFASYLQASYRCVPGIDSPTYVNSPCHLAVMVV